MRTARCSSRLGGLHQAPPQERAPPGAGTGTPRDQTPPGPGTPPVDRHTPVSILPCPKLHLRPVKIENQQYTRILKVNY